jgi:CelD/BcsL family acetyltransferase involved in cellulose biosynthesis
VITTSRTRAPLAVHLATVPPHPISQSSGCAPTTSAVGGVAGRLSSIVPSRTGPSVREADRVERLRVSEHRGAEALDHPAWEQLRGERAWSPFVSPAYLKAWWAELGGNADLRALVFLHGERPRAVAALTHEERNGVVRLRSLGGLALTDYCGPLCAEAEREPVARALVEWFGASVPRGLLHLQNIHPALALPSFVESAAAGGGLAVDSRSRTTGAALELPGSWDEYLSRLPRRERHELRRKLRRFERERGAPRLRTADRTSLERDVQTFVGLHRRSRGRKASFMRPEVARFFRSLAFAFAASGWLRLSFLESGGATLAAAFGFTADGVYYLYNMAFEPAAASLSPGTVLLAQLLRQTIDEELRTFDFLRGGERYKFDLGAEPVALGRVRIAHVPQTGPGDGSG